MSENTHTPFNVVPASLPAVSRSIYTTERHLYLFITVLFCFVFVFFVGVGWGIFFFFLFQRVDVHVSLLSIDIVQCKCMNQLGMENSVGVLNKSHISPPPPFLNGKNGYLAGNEEEEMLFSKLNTVFQIL